ncbi:hypothetical protein SLEP1_g5984 [Rubroshorea leprosula]|uniref:Bifunctional inhibitor/plant lipid transfer protein/seed storage helical domain-containing protein n=1 Tax=Rubroshorea leprosula TaxID=152421 RepID=A0AAV5HTQ0_9ROSI|nr:hypothetical protein SLEP1_g5984 [Rubroshorea leprosula]
MATTNTQFTTTLAAFLIIAAITVSHDGLVSGQGCQADLQNLVAQCAMYVQRAGPKLNPSPSCCSVVVHVDIPCICNYITSGIERVIDMEKVTYVAGYCGKALAPGTKCGSYTVPGSAEGEDEENEFPIPSVGSDEVPVLSVEEEEAPSPSPSPSVAADDGEPPEVMPWMPWMPWIIRGPRN